MLLLGTIPPLVIGVVIALVLFVVGVSLGYVLGRRQHLAPLAAATGGSTSATEGLSPAERERIVALLQQISNWTSEYSGNVSQYQNRLGEIRREVREDAPQSSDRNRIAEMLETIMQTNEQLQKRLDAAERQLEKQTRQIESYLSEARTDALTGLSNRRAFDQKLEELFSAFRKGGRAFSLALIDIDHFKRINDTHGHQAGDQVLQQLASQLNQRLQPSLMIARFGGEEFVAILDTPLKQAADQLNKFRKALAAERLDAGAAKIEVTLSVGLAEPRDEMVPAPTVRRADEALYAAKNIGRNRVYYHDGTAPVLVGAPETSR